MEPSDLTSFRTPDLSGHQNLPELHENQSPPGERASTARPQEIELMELSTVPSELEGSVVELQHQPKDEDVPPLSKKPKPDAAPIHEGSVEVAPVPSKEVAKTGEVPKSVDKLRAMLFKLRGQDALDYIPHKGLMGLSNDTIGVIIGVGLCVGVLPGLVAMGIFALAALVSAKRISSSAKQEGRLGIALDNSARDKTPQALADSLITQAEQFTKVTTRKEFERARNKLALSVNDRDRRLDAGVAYLKNTHLAPEYEWDRRKGTYKPEDTAFSDPLPAQAKLLAGLEGSIQLTIDELEIQQMEKGNDPQTETLITELTRAKKEISEKRQAILEQIALTTNNTVVENTEKANGKQLHTFAYIPKGMKKIESDLSSLKTKLADANTKKTEVERQLNTMKEEQYSIARQTEANIQLTKEKMFSQSADKSKTAYEIQNEIDKLTKNEQAIQGDTTIERMEFFSERLTHFTQKEKELQTHIDRLEKDKIILTQITTTKSELNETEQAFLNPLPPTHGQLVAQIKANIPARQPQEDDIPEATIVTPGPNPPPAPDDLTRLTESLTAKRHNLEKELDKGEELVKWLRDKPEKTVNVQQLGKLLEIYNGILDADQQYFVSERELVNHRKSNQIVEQPQEKDPINTRSEKILADLSPIIARLGGVKKIERALQQATLAKPKE